jgi:hypothetical protein
MTEEQLNLRRLRRLMVSTIIASIIIFGFVFLSPQDHSVSIIDDWYHNQRMIKYKGMTCIEKRFPHTDEHTLFCDKRMVVTVYDNDIDEIIKMQNTKRERIY